MNTSEANVNFDGISFVVSGLFHDLEDFELTDVHHKGESVINLLEAKVVKALEDRAFEKLLAEHLEHADDMRADKAEAVKEMRRYG